MQRAVRIISAAALAALFLFSCAQDVQLTSPNDQAKLLAGTWTLEAKIEDGKEAPVSDRLMRLVLHDEGTYQADYRGDETQQWIAAGRGVFSFVPPVLTFFWDSGNISSFLVLDRQSKRLHLHHGVNLAPLKDQSPDEVYRLQKKSGTPAPQKQS